MYKRQLVPYLRDVRCIANADSPEEYDFLTHTQLPDMIISAGIHPWKADCTSWDAMERHLHTVAALRGLTADALRSVLMHLSLIHI